MKKIITAKSQWQKALQDIYYSEGNSDSGDLHDFRIVDDGIGLVGENEMYHMTSADGSMDYFFMKVGNEYSCWQTDHSKEYILAHNYDLLDSKDAWYDHDKLMKWFLDCKIGCINEDFSLESPIEFYELVWMHIYRDCDGLTIRYASSEQKCECEEIDNLFREVANTCDGKNLSEIAKEYRVSELTVNGRETYLTIEYKGCRFIVEETGNDGELALSESVYDIENGIEYLAQDGMRTLLPREIHLKAGLPNEAQLLLTLTGVILDTTKSHLVEEIASLFAKGYQIDNDYFPAKMFCWEDSQGRFNSNVRDIKPRLVYNDDDTVCVTLLSPNGEYKWSSPLKQVSVHSLHDVLYSMRQEKTL